MPCLWFQKLLVAVGIHSYFNYISETEKFVEFILPW